MRARRIRRIVVGLILALAAFFGTAAFIFREDIVRTWLDPKQPFQTYKPPPAPDYASPASWAMLPADGGQGSAADPVADVFFIHPTTFNGGADWNGGIGERGGERFLQDVILPNYAGPYQRLARVFAPRYRQASLYAFMTNREDAQDARRFAYQDVLAAFRRFIAAYNDGRPFFLVGVEQGGALGARLIRDVIAPDPSLSSRLVSAVLVDAVVPDEAFERPPVAACRSPTETGCVLAWQSAKDDEDADKRRRRALVWTADNRLENLGARAPLCVNPLLGVRSDAEAPPRLDLGSTNASGLEWGARPAFLGKAVGAQCKDGFLMTTAPVSATLRRSGGWIDRLKAAPFNLFYLNEETDAERRLRVLTSRPGYTPPSPRVGGVISVAHAPIHQAP